MNSPHHAAWADGIACQSGYLEDSHFPLSIYDHVFDLWSVVGNTEMLSELFAQWCDSCHVSVSLQ